MSVRRLSVQAKRDRRPHYSALEVSRLTGQTLAVSRKSLRHLEAAGLVVFKVDALDLAREPSKLCSDCVEVTDSMLNAIRNNRRKVPVPRRMIRFLASHGTSGMIGTVFGHLLRGMYFRAGACVAEGACKASWIADTFGLDERTVSRNRRELIGLGWLKPLNADQWYLNRYGWRFQMNLEWSATNGSKADDACRMPPRKLLVAAKLPAPIENQNPLKGSKNQKPFAPTGRTGFRKRKDEGGSPTLRHIVRADLDEPSRLLRLFDEARRAGVAKESEAGRLEFFALAARARRVGTSNACGLFSALLRKQCWHFASQDDEDLARQMLRGTSLQLAPVRSECRVLAKALEPHHESLSEQEIRQMIAASLASVAIPEDSLDGLTMQHV